MSRLFSLAGFLLICSSAFAFDDKDNATYADLVNRVSAGDLSIDFRALRFACLKDKKCSLEGDSQEWLAARNAMQEKDYAGAAKKAEAIIAKGFPNMDAHALASRAYKELNDSAQSQFHHDVTAKLIQSIMQSGDGKTKETAFEVASVHEEYIIMQVLGLPRPTSQALVPGKPHNYDRLESADPKTGAKVQIYFLIDAFFPMKGL